MAFSIPFRFTLDEHESPDFSRRLRYAVETSDTVETEAASGVREQADAVAPDRSSRRCRSHTGKRRFSSPFLPQILDFLWQYCVQTYLV
jgi:hypothetical protein